MIVQRQIDLKKITNADGTEVDPLKEEAFLDKVGELLTNLNTSSYSGAEAELSQAAVKSLFEMLEIYALITE
jgi:hypothetical protein